MTIQSKRPSTRIPQTVFLLTALLAFVLVPSAFGQSAASTAQAITLNATLTESLTVSATPTTVNFALVSGGSAAGDAPVVITTAWVLAANRSNFYLYGYFTSAAHALQGATTNTIYIPSSAIYGTVTTGVPTTATAFTQSSSANGLTVGTANASLELLAVPITSANYSSTESDSLALSIDLSGLPQLAAQVYSGTLYLQAQAL